MRESQGTSFAIFLRTMSSSRTSGWASTGRTTRPGTGVQGREGGKGEVDGEGLSKLLSGGHQGGFIQKLAFGEARVGKISFGKLSRGKIMAAIVDGCVCV